eukprot:TRINITY_DN29606_c0_g1_i1.p1 TRINITY_DN29606_c0_g1~~TRINITY_DN29606_c0_g1_i1.p1  ORF type:complete len:424 (-),score=54.34 TRINITY_DN29606_c0_g1_i1:66-1337(-)
MADNAPHPVAMPRRPSLDSTTSISFTKLESRGARSGRCVGRALVFASRIARQNTMPLAPFWWYSCKLQTVCAGLAFGTCFGLGLYFSLGCQALHEIVVPYSHADGQSKLFRIDKDIEGDVFMYYELPGVILNNKGFVESRDRRFVTTFLSPATCSDADDFGWVEKHRGSDLNFTARIHADGTNDFVPCGLIAVSFFTDRYHVFRWTPNGTSFYWEAVQVDSSDIALPADKHGYSKKVSVDDSGRLVMSGAASWLMLDDYEHWKVWSRTPIAPHVRNLYAVISGGLPKGEYKIEFLENSAIWETWGVKEKRVIFAAMSSLGNQRALLTMSLVCIVLAILECLFFFMFILGHAARGSLSARVADISGCDDTPQSNGDFVRTNSMPARKAAEAAASVRAHEMTEIIPLSPQADGAPRRSRHRASTT